MHCARVKCTSKLPRKREEKKSCPRRRASNGDEVVCGEKSESFLSCNDAFLKNIQSEAKTPMSVYVPAHFTDPHWSAAHEDPGKTPQCLFSTPISKHLQGDIGKRCPARHSNQQIAEESQQQIKQTNRCFFRCRGPWARLCRGPGKSQTSRRDRRCIEAQSSRPH